LDSKYGTANPEFVGEARRIVDAAKSEGVLLRLLGALAFHIHCPKFSYMQQMLGRSFTDIDFASYRKQTSKISKLFAELGYQEDMQVTALFGSGRLVFYEKSGTKIHCDVFLDKLDFCHEITFQNRLELDEPTAPLSELLLEKMQIVKLNEKDAIDTIMLFREHNVGSSDNETINADYIANLTARDWGLWRTLTMNLERVQQKTKSLEKLSNEDKTDVDAKIKILRARLDQEPKSRGWKFRAQIGDKKKWYKDVEELSRD
jgi:hypothetical protein